MPRPSIAVEGALAGVRVIEVGESGSSAYAGRLLADLGADVLKIEAPGRGDPARSEGPFAGEPGPDSSARFIYLNTNKGSVTLNLEVAAGRDLLFDLSCTADAVVSSHRPRRTASVAARFPELEKRNPNIVVVSISPFGETGPYRDWAGYDLNTGALGGICQYLGESGREPLAPPVPIGEYQAGLVAVIPILVALATGAGGQYIDVSESDCWATIQTGLSIVEFIYGGRLFERRGGTVKGGPFPNALFRCKDGVVRIVCMQRREWERFVSVMGSPAWAQDPRFQDRVKMNELYSDELTGLVEAWMADKSKQEIFVACRDAGVPCGPLNTMADVVAEPELNRWLHPGGAPTGTDEPARARVGGFAQPGFPYGLSGTPPEIGRDAPRLGEHTASALAEVGVNRTAYERLLAAGVV